MFDGLVHPGAAQLLARLDGVLDELDALALDRHTDSEIVALWGELETRRNRFAVNDHALIAQAQQRRLDTVTGAKNLVCLARQVLRVSARQAGARIRAAEALGPRRSLTGETLPPIYPTIADAEARGEVSATAAALIVTTIEDLPDQVRAEHDRPLEELLTGHASSLDLDCLRIIAHRLSATLDPDGRFKDLAYRDKHRDIRILTRRDGSSRLEIEATAELTERARTLFDTLGKPRPETNGRKDPRSGGQRRHDALLDALKLLDRAEALPTCAGITATITLTMSTQDYLTGAGYARTGHGTLIPTPEALTWTGGDARIMTVVLNHLNAVTHYSSNHRIFTENQRQAMTARDGGCSFPGCDTPPAHCQAHHITDYTAGGPTSINNGTLLCGLHHREHTTKMGWTCTMINNTPHWIPPPWLDPDQTPQQNHMHNPAGG